VVLVGGGERKRVREQKMMTAASVCIVFWSFSVML